MDVRFLKSVFCKSGISRMTHSVQTLVFLRHGEKPDNDSGQLTGKGLNRALALADLLIARYGKADALYAAAPKQSKLGNSLRSLQTITPVAVRLSLPVHLEFHAKETKALRDALLDKAHHGHTVFVVWEHDNLIKVVRDILKQTGGDYSDMPAWPRDDFDSLWILTITRSQTETTVTFSQEKQGLDNLDSYFPPAR
ncbi:histidine phosphatase family protein [Morganella morganii subsp. morganii]|nr:histidine phosphatase family protein [Morganella morganii subsp. morganii]